MTGRDWRNIQLGRDPAGQEWGGMQAVIDWSNGGSGVGHLFRIRPGGFFRLVKPDSAAAVCQSARVRISGLRVLPVDSDADGATSLPALSKSWLAAAYTRRTDLLEHNRRVFIIHTILILNVQEAFHHSMQVPALCLQNAQPEQNTERVDTSVCQLARIFESFMYFCTFR